ncbi:sushi, von Willebrand factor type A, EGF and pentraxin domain-containing protein 1 [Lingula anatina]|uniref:Sushi, von Willebrand factor type A, EGF and pentraxin domain-containing protein 1 n=1 Tax=Lingula anatina TaxID=7574 RepID=A0A1S3IMG5_LINAN|nr:sushi, von Willebrand factor type A, EGF and pentraxin domain-containing protein 1 [Lingula anatina]|eukprot:XP_013398724.1 sushi, von Willebrand factor type A, EGF and pentraxin domain-containing protein 1 [Lingula anatina]
MVVTRDALAFILALFVSELHNVEQRAITKRDIINPASCGFPNLPRTRRLIPQTTSRIIGGIETEPFIWPWMTYIEIIDGLFCSGFCGGSLISPQWVLTAAHCVYTSGLRHCPYRKRLPTEFTVHFAVHDVQNKLLNPGYANRTVAEIIDHPQFSRDRFTDYLRNDLALLRLSSPVTYSQDIGPICLPADTEIVDDRTKCKVAGWGDTIGDPAIFQSSRKLQEVDLDYMSTPACRTSSWYSFPITDDMICATAKNKDTCGGDSGGPLACNFTVNGREVWRQVGIVSFGSSYCGNNVHYPGVYTNLGKYYDWIRDTTNLALDCAKFGCEQYCSQLDRRYDPTCLCMEGYVLDQNGRNCTDINECGVNNGGCEDVCINEEGGYRCACFPSRVLSNDGLRCADNITIHCPSPPKPQNGNVTCKENPPFTPGAICDQECLPGFESTDDPVLECNEHGIWEQGTISCRDKNECLVYNGGCDQDCFNTIGGVECGCLATGFTLQPDGKTCKDTEPPYFSQCPSEITARASAGEKEAVVDLSNNVAYADNVNARLISGTRPGPRTFEIGVHVVTFIVTDDSGNTAQCNVTVVIQDKEKPTIRNCPGPITKQVEQGRKVLVTWNDLGISDNSGHFSIVDNIPDGQLFPVGVYWARFTVTDGSGNTNTCSFRVKVKHRNHASCPELRSPANGKIECSYWGFRKYCYFHCNSGYTSPVVGQFFVCSPQGDWKPSTSIPDCT